jgi:hypothetical protein
MGQARRIQLPLLNPDANIWHARAVAHRTKTYRLNSYRFASRAKRYSRQMKLARYADYSHSTLSNAYSYRAY